MIAELDCYEDLKMSKEQAYLHIIDADKDVEIVRRIVCFIPRVGDEIRLGGKGKEKYYKVTMIVWAYDEDSVFERVNVGVTEITI